MYLIQMYLLFFSKNVPVLYFYKSFCIHKNLSSSFCYYIFFCVLLSSVDKLIVYTIVYNYLLCVRTVTLALNYSKFQINTVAPWTMASQASKYAVTKRGAKKPKTTQISTKIPTMPTRNAKNNI